MLKKIECFSMLIMLILIAYCCKNVPKGSEFKLFDETPVLINELKIPRTDFKFALYFIPSNASSQEYIQIRKIYKDQKAEVLENYERYNAGKMFLEDLKSIKIALVDTLVSGEIKYDTIYINIDH